MNGQKEVKQKERFMSLYKENLRKERDVPAMDML